MSLLPLTSRLVRRVLLAALLLVALIAGALYGPCPDAQARAANPLAALERHAPRAVEGVVAERLDAGSYTYLRLGAPDTHGWIVVMGRAPAVGQSARLTLWGAAADFHSSRLERTFASLRFATNR
jgi:hypothetical protein